MNFRLLVAWRLPIPNNLCDLCASVCSVSNKAGACRGTFFNSSRFVEVTGAEGPLPDFAGTAPTAPAAGIPPVVAPPSDAGAPPFGGADSAVAAMRSRTARPSASASAAPPADRAQALQPVRAPALASGPTSPTRALPTPA
jgi:hypothetical protein